MKAKGLFITGTGTGVGKTMVTRLLCRYLSENNHKAISQKWIETGCCHKTKLKKSSSYVYPYIFKYPSSPHLASRLEDKRINEKRIRESFEALAKQFNFVIVEGIGGVLVPYNQGRLVIDIAKGLHLPVLVVTQNKLGAINHTLLSIEALLKRKIKILGIIFNNAPKTQKLILRDNPQIIKKISGQKVLGILPYEKNMRRLYRNFIPIGENIKAELLKNG